MPTIDLDLLQITDHPDDRAHFAKCELRLEGDTLIIDCPPCLWPIPADHIIPDRFEVNQIEFWCAGERRVWASAVWWQRG